MDIRQREVNYESSKSKKKQVYPGYLYISNWDPAICYVVQSVAKCRNNFNLDCSSFPGHSRLLKFVKT